MSSSLLTPFGLSGGIQAIATGNTWSSGSGEPLTVQSPIDRADLASFQLASAAQVSSVIASSTVAFDKLRVIPAPRRGEFVRRFAETLREHQEVRPATAQPIHSPIASLAELAPARRKYAPAVAMPVMK